VATAGHVTYQPIEVLEGELVNQWLKSTEHCTVITDHGAAGPKCFIMLTYSPVQFVYAETCILLCFGKNMFLLQ